MATDPYVSVLSVLQQRDERPLDFWHFSIPRAKQGVQLLADGAIEELYCRKPNKGGGTELACAAVLACLQKRPTLDGVRLPQWRGPVAGLALCLDYTQQKLSVQQTILRLLGRWPHHAHWKGDGILSSVSIKPEGGTDDETTWSTLTLLSQENKDAGVGARADVVWADEPPVENTWRELRKAAHAGRRMIRIISATPLERKRWHWLAAEYGDTPRKTLRRVNDAWAEVRWSLEEVPGWILSPLEKSRLMLSYQRDPFERGDKKARSHGDYKDVSGSSAFYSCADVLERMLSECVEPEIVEWPIRYETKEGVTTKRESRSAIVEVFKRAEPGKSYWCAIDPSSGIDDGNHDPYDLTISEIGTGDLCLHSSGHLAGKLVGILGAGLCRQYNGALADPEVNDKWGVNVVEGFHYAGYGNFARDRVELRPGEFIEEIGFHNTASTRPKIIGAIQDWLEQSRAGIVYGRCPSRFILSQLADCILDEDNKIVAAPGLHDDALITWGECLRRSVTPSGRAVPMLQAPARTADQRLADRILGKRNGFLKPNGVAMVPKDRP